MTCQRWLALIVRHFLPRWYAALVVQVGMWRQRLRMRWGGPEDASTDCPQSLMIKAVAEVNEGCSSIRGSKGLEQWVFALIPSDSTQAQFIRNFVVGCRLCSEFVPRCADLADYLEAALVLAVDQDEPVRAVAQALEATASHYDLW